MQIERLDSAVRLHGAQAVRAELRPPGSKSVTNRYLACLALADGQSRLEFASICDDTRAMAGALEGLGLPVAIDEPAERMALTGRGGYFPNGEATLNLGHAGTAMRFSTALAALGRGRYRLDGSERMRQRPIGDLTRALEQIGARIGFEQTPGCPPLNILAQGLRGGTVRFEAPPSSQYISALLMAAPYAQQDVMVAIERGVPSKPYIAMTIDIMQELGVEVVNEDYSRLIVPAAQRYRPGSYRVEPDASGATYLWAAAALTGGSVTVSGLTRSSRQGDVQFVDVLAQMGCEVEESDSGLTVAAPADGRLKGIEIDLNAMPDTVQTLAALALFAAGPTVVRNVANLRIKETNRIAALEAELERCGAQVTVLEDGLRIEPPTHPRPATISTYDDHRMAMSFALVGLRVPGITIREPEVVSKSFPNFFDVLARLDEAPAA
jgi:3-phosphoshikimate 1-carboxyvinyltransferase